MDSDQPTVKAQVQLRDANGRFIKTSKITATASISSPTQVQIKPELEKPLLQVTVTNPIKKILYWLDEIRKKQTTTFAFKISIPLIALPVIIFTAFQLGRGSITLPFIALSSSAPSPSSVPALSATPAPVPYSRSGTLKIAKTENSTKYILGLKNGENVLLWIPPQMDISKYQNKQVLVTGIFDKQANLIKVSEIAQIEVFNETFAPSPTPTPAQTPNPQATSSAQ